jgi:hypothetical protein
MQRSGVPNLFFEKIRFKKVYLIMIIHARLM